MRDAQAQVKETGRLRRYPVRERRFGGPGFVMVESRFDGYFSGYRPALESSSITPTNSWILRRCPLPEAVA
jgi:hypothetical protein